MEKTTSTKKICPVLTKQLFELFKQENFEKITYIIYKFGPEDLALFYEKNGESLMYYGLFLAQSSLSLKFLIENLDITKACLQKYLKKRLSCFNSFIVYNAEKLESQITLQKKMTIQTNLIEKLKMVMEIGDMEINDMIEKTYQNVY